MNRVFEFDFRPGAVFGIFVLVVFVALVFTIWMIVDAIGRPESDFSSPGAKTGWIAGMIVGIFFGVSFFIALVYLFAVRLPARRRSAARTWGDPGGDPGAGPYPPQAPPGPAPPPPPGAPPAAPLPPAVHCRNCGAKLAAGARFCHSCGTPVV